MTLKELEDFNSPNDLGECGDLTGRKFGRLTVLKYAGKDKRNLTTWYCKCSCGNLNAIGPVPRNYLISKRKQSCGCLHTEVINKICKKENEIDFLNKNIIKVYTKSGFFICDYEDWIKYNCKEIRWNLKWEKKSKKYNIYPFGLTKKFTSFPENTHYYFCRLIMEVEDSKINIDHKNGCTLDCRRKNLRICEQKENKRNTRLFKHNNSGITGVGWSKTCNKWRARICVNNKDIHLGLFDNIEDAIEARRDAENKYFGEFSTINSRGEENRTVPITIDEVISKILKGEDI